MTAERRREATRHEQRGGHGYHLTTVIDVASGVRHCGTDPGFLAAATREVLRRAGR